MANHLLCKTPVAIADLIEIDGEAAVERHAALREALAARAGPEAAALFAEPLLSRGNDAAPATIAWYGEAPDDGVTLDGLAPSSRVAAERWLADHLRPVAALADDPALGPLVRAALATRGRDDIRMAGGRPVIVNWGQIPAEIAADPVRREAHLAAALGRFVMLPPSALRGAAAVGAAAAATAARLAPAATAAETPAAAAVAPRSGWAAVVPLAVLLLLAGGVLLWLTRPGVRVFPPTPPAVAIDSGAAAALADQANADLRARRDALRAAIEGAQCRADGILVVPGIDGPVTPEGLPPLPAGAPPAEAQSRPALVPPADRVLVPEASPPDGTMLTRTLLAHIEARTVFIVAQGGGATSTGSGFVIAPGLVMTNAHVIAGGGEIRVAHARLAAPVPATVVAQDGPLETTGGDFALLRVAADLPSFDLHVPADDRDLRLTGVIAAGFPGDLLDTDGAFREAIQRGALTAPELTLTEGVISTAQRVTPTSHVLVHSAAIASGNSGGPLVDLCGRVVGINTFVRTGPMRTLNFALAARDLIRFVGPTGTAVPSAAGACAPRVLAPAPSGAPAEAAPPPPAE